MTAPNDSGLLPLSRLLRETGDALMQRAPPAALLQRLQRELRPSQPWQASVVPLQGATSSVPYRPGAGWQRWLAGSGVASLGLALVLSVLLMLPSRDASRGPVVVPGAGGFLPLVPAERWRQLARESDEPAWLVRGEIQRERLVALGLPYDPSRASGMVQAELLMHASGTVLALRLVD